MAEFPPFVCALCGKNYTTKKILKRHTSSCREKSTVECRFCLKKYYGKKTLENHIKKVHECHLCHKTLAQRQRLADHLVEDHNEKILFECYHCTRTFYRKAHLASHIGSCRNYSNNEKSISDVYRFKCSVCYQVFPSKKCINMHYRNVHEITLEIQTVMLKSIVEFDKWISETEYQSNAHFINKCSRESKTHYIGELVCHRSSITRAHSKRTTEDESAKKNYSKKLETFCPAEMNVFISKADETCVVKYTKTHLGHSTDASGEEMF